MQCGPVALCDVALPHLGAPLSFRMAIDVAAISLGSNLGDRVVAIHAAVERLGVVPGVRLLAVSSLIVTAPVRVAPGVDPGGEYVNAAALIETSRSPLELLIELHAIERGLGRDRTQQPHGGARVIDLDLLVCGEHVIETPELRLPHPGIASRAFVLRPLAEIAPSLRVPVWNATVAELLERLSVQSNGANR